ncbi:MAG: MoaD/ThiS family protein [Thermoplasmatota archaeon]
MPLIRVTVRYLGTLSQLAGRREETLRVREGATVGELSELLAIRHGRELGRRLRDETARPVLFIVGDEPAPPERRLEDGDMVVLSYPAGGG